MIIHSVEGQHRSPYSAIEHALYAMEAPARQKGGIASRRNYSCDTAQLFGSRLNSNCVGSLNGVGHHFDLCRDSIRIETRPK